jgi:tripartite-type tricarboxylate transporter receptor subunit TctC
LAITYLKKEDKKMFKKSRKSVIVCSTLFLLLGLMSYSSMEAAEFPNKTIELIVPFKPGGGTDLTARVIVNAAARYFPVTVRAVNMPGAAGTLGTNHVYKAKPDGYTILVRNHLAHNMSTIANKAEWGKKGFKALLTYSREQNVIAVHKNSQWKTFSQLVDYVRSNPKQLTMAIVSYGSSGGLFALKVADKLGLKIIYVPYGSSTPSMTALLGEHVDAVAGDLTPASVFIKDGSFRALVISGDKRDKNLPDIPTILEKTGHKDLVQWVDRAFYVKPNIPQERMDYLQKMFKKVLEDKKCIEQGKKIGMNPAFIGSEESTEGMYQTYDAIEKYRDLIFGKK